MRNYIVGRLILSLIALVVVTFVVFGSIRLLPGDIASVLLGGLYNPEAEARLREELGLNKPLPVAYATWLGGLLRGDLGRSLFTGQSVAAEIQDRLPTTVELTVLALLVSILLAFPIGTLSAVKRGTMVDALARGLAILLVSVPFFWIAVLLLTVPARTIGWSPPRGYVHFWDDPVQNLSVLLLPALVLGLSLSGRSMRMLRTTLLEVLGLDYIRTARAKGLQEFTVLARHALRNALIPVITIIGLEFAFFIGGTVVIETLFGIPGMGSLTIESINTRDFTTVMGVTVVFSALVIAINLVVDLSYGVLNPRVRG